jgi:hypothetical protein
MTVFGGTERHRTDRRPVAGLVLLSFVVGYHWPLMHAAFTFQAPAIGGSINDALMRSIGFGLALAGMTTVLGALVAVTISHVMRPGPRFLAALLLPAFLGDTMFAYVSRCLFPVGVLLSERESVASMGWLLALQMLQYLPLVTCFYLIVFGQIDQGKIDFARYERLTVSEKTRLLLMPESCFYTTIISVYIFYCGVNCYDLPTILLRASEGTHLEFLNHALDRLYRVSPMWSKAGAAMFEGAKAAGMLFLLGVIWVMVWHRVHSWIVCTTVQGIGHIASSSVPAATRFLAIPGLLGIAIVAPFWGVIVGAMAHFSGARTITLSEMNIPLILRSFMATGVAATLIFAALLVVSVWIRQRPGLAMHLRHATLDTASVLAIFVGLSVPSMCIALTAMHWRLTLFSSMGGAFVFIPWMMAHFAAELPVLLFFLYVTSLGVTDDTVDFALVSRMSLKEKIFVVFFDRNLMAYQLVYLIGIMGIWSNTAVNTLFGPYIYPTSVALHNALTSGRGLIGAASLLLLPTVMLAIFCCMIFYKMTERKVG